MDEGEAEARSIYLFIIHLDNMMGQVKKKTMAISLWTFKVCKGNNLTSTQLP